MEGGAIEGDPDWRLYTRTPSFQRYTIDDEGGKLRAVKSVDST